MVSARGRRRGSLLGGCISLTLLCGWQAACALFPTRDEPLEYPEPEINERIGFANDVLARVLAREYDQLDELARELRSGKARFPNGEWKLRWFYVAFSQLAAGRSWYPVPLLGQNPDWDTVRSRLEEWLARMPNSATPRVALAQFWIAYAWDARGTSSADKVSDEQWALFRERLDQAAKVLVEARRIEEKCPEWWLAAQRVALGQGWERPRVNELMEDAVAFEPEYDAFYSAFAYHLAPHWYGKPGEWEREASRWAERLGSPRGEITYARVLWAWRNLGQWNAAIEGTEVDWELAKRGFLALREQHSGSFEIQSMFAFISAAARDRDQARSLMEAIGNRMDRGVWRDEKEFLRFRNWALRS